MTAPAAEVPTWVPPAVRQYVHRTKTHLHFLISGVPGSDADAAQAFDNHLRRRLATIERLATNPMMKHVWRTLAMRRASDKDLIRFFETASMAGDRVPIRPEKDRAEIVSQASSAAKFMRSLVALFPSLAEELGPSITRCEMVARDVDFYFGRKVPVVNRIKDEQARAYVWMLGEETRNLFDDTLRGTVATVATIALEKPITERQVRNWCSGWDTPAGLSSEK